jgi:hypothetical protein
MSLILASMLNFLGSARPLPTFTSSAHMDNPLQQTLTLYNTSPTMLTGIDYHMNTSLPLKLIGSASTCLNISLVHPLKTHDSCTYVFQMLPNMTPMTQRAALTLSATNSIEQNYFRTLQVQMSTYLYAATLQSVLRWDGNTWAPVGTVNIPTQVRALKFDAQNNLYVGTNYSVQFWDGAHWNIVGLNPPVSVNALSFNADGMLIAGSATQGAQIFIPAQNRWYALGQNGPIDITALLQVPRTAMLYAGTNDFTQEFDGTHWQPTPGKPLLGSSSFALNQEQQLLYTGDDAGTVYQLNPTYGWINKGQPGGPYDIIDSLIFDKNLLIAGIDNEAHSIKSAQADFTWVDYGQHAPAFVTALIADAQDHLYAANYGNGPNVYQLSGGAQDTWQALVGAPHDTFVNALALGSELKISM